MGQYSSMNFFSSFKVQNSHFKSDSLQQISPSLFLDGSCTSLEWLDLISLRDIQNPRLWWQGHRSLASRYLISMLFSAIKWYNTKCEILFQIYLKALSLFPRATVSISWKSKNRNTFMRAKAKLFSLVPRPGIQQSLNKCLLNEFYN